MPLFCGVLFNLMLEAGRWKMEDGGWKYSKSYLIPPTAYLIYGELGNRGFGISDLGNRGQ